MQVNTACFSGPLCKRVRAEMLCFKFPMDLDLFESGMWVIGRKDVSPPYLDFIKCEIKKDLVYKLLLFGIILGDVLTTSLCTAKLLHLYLQYVIE